MRNWREPLQTLKPGTRSAFFTQAFARLVLSVVVALSVSCAKPRIEFHCPFGPRNADAAAEELAGALDDAPYNFEWIGYVEHKCGFIDDDS